MTGYVRALFILVAGITTAVAQSNAPSAPTGPGSLSGIWQAGRMWQGAPANTLGSLRTPEWDRVIKTSTGEIPPMLPWARELLEKRIKMSQEGEPEALTPTQCLPSIPAFLLGGPYPIQILETPGQVTMLLEEQNHYRVIYLDSKHPADPDPTFMGHSTGRWENGTLVVDTIGLIERTPIDRVGVPHSAALHLIERYRRVDKDSLEVIITIDDPKTFSKQWDAKVPYRAAPAGTRLTEYICENNRDF